MDISAMDPQSIQQLFDAEVVGPGDEAIGNVEQIFADDVTGAPTFVTVKDAGTESFLPVSGADYDGGRIEVPFSKDVVEAAPSARGGEDLSPEREAEVYRYYGIRAPRRSSEVESRPADDWGDDVADTSVDQDVDQVDQGDFDHEVVPDDATAATVQSEDEPQFEPTEEAEDPATDFRSVAEIDEQQDPAVPEPDEVSSDETAAEESAVIAGGSFPGVATAAGLVTAGAAEGAAAATDRSDDAVATGDPDAELDADTDPGLEAATGVDEAALATDRADGESPEAARENEIEAEAAGEDAADEASEFAEEDPGEDGAQHGEQVQDADGAVAGPVSTLPGLPAGATLRKYVVTEMVTVQIPVRRDVVCWVDADGGVHELEAVEAPDSATDKDLHDPASWWFGSEEGADVASDDVVVGEGPDPEEESHRPEA
ncbi:hypothetical protein [Acidipropionibacterium virtanenii]|uniref:PRC-barrel domain-containing protein n=1 Tax=Acidipropionibacterium virtanenii TaxID=2057246 RepID=A0A344UQU1_9ACTN|nr:hypothetical protein [Acidipropionibacterium virtanenii]AXE37639.1 hypothetical protein JS278_00446 [Acidipropionibacterium virtanenii]